MFTHFSIFFYIDTYVRIQQAELSANWSGYGDPQGDMHSWSQDEDEGVLTGKY